jgi:hypothetical protein
LTNTRGGSVWAYRHKVQDRRPLRLREDTPLVPAEAARQGAPH